MSGHVALIVEDEDEARAEIKLLIESRGDTAVEAATREEALEKIAQGGFCYALLDLEIKPNAESMRGKVEAGLSVLRELRVRFPKGTLPALVLSGHARQDFNLYYKVREQLEADDFLQKPISHNSPPFDDRLDACLKKTGRAEHEQCTLALTEMATAQAASDAKARRFVLEITGKVAGYRTEVQLDGKSFQLTTEVFLTLLRLVAARIREKDGWIFKGELGATDDKGWKVVSRIQEQLGAGLPKGVKVHENHKKQYRLNPAIEVATINWNALERHPEDDIRDLATEIRPVFKAGKKKKS